MAIYEHSMVPLISVIIPNYNGEKTLDLCLTAATSIKDEAVEIIVVDDGSEDRSREIIRRFPCTLIESSPHAGASRARNLGAQQANGDILFFTDADCLLQENTLAQLRTILSQADSNTIIGGSYTPQPYDQGFFSRFQSVFINYSETRNPLQVDYIATHAMAIHTDLFHRSGGFTEDQLPILEDVEFSHRLRRAGVTLMMQPAIQVQHIFDFSLRDSCRNAVRKTRYWIQYSLKNQDLFADSGTASIELKLNVCIFFLSLLLLFSLAQGITTALAAIIFLCVINIYINRKLFKAFYDADGPIFSLGAGLYYLLVYPLPVAVGSIAGFSCFLHNIARNKG
jgi:GT2 family glycosyltransferase